MRIARSPFPHRSALALLAAGGLALAGGPDLAAQQPAPPAARPAPVAPGVPATTTLNFRDAPLEQVLYFYADLRGKTILSAPGVNSTVTLRTHDKLSAQEAADLIEGYLIMFNIGLVEDGKLLRVVPLPDVHRETAEIVDYDTAPPRETARGMMTRRIRLKYLTPTQVVELLTPIKHPAGVIQFLETMNAILVTDTAPNLRKMKALLDDTDLPVLPRETRIYQLRHHTPSLVKTALEGLFEQPSPAPAAPMPVPASPTPPGVIRATRPQMAPRNDPAPSLVRDAVNISPDDRTGVLLVVSRAENFAIIDKVVTALDQPMAGKSEPAAVQQPPKAP